MTWKQYLAIGMLVMIMIEVPTSAGHFVAQAVGGFLTFVHSAFHS